MISYDSVKVLTLVEEILGKSKSLKNGEYTFFCPACHHHKRKLQVNISDNPSKAGSWHCWVCEDTNGTKGKNFYSLFKKFGANQDQMRRLSDTLGDIRFIPETTEKESFLSLPKEFISLQEKSKSLIYQHAINYLQKRNINEDDIIKYNLGYCEDGKYQNRIIVPSYDEAGKLNYFTARSFYSNVNMKYLNPPAGRDIIGFELFINWNTPIVLVEGPFDAIAVKRNVIPLFGKTISQTLKLKILEKKVKNIYISLDEDALSSSTKLAEEFINEGLNVYFVKLQGKDPADLGLEAYWRLVEHTNKLTFYDLVKIKMR